VPPRRHAGRRRGAGETGGQVGQHDVAHVAPGFLGALARCGCSTTWSIALFKPPGVAPDYVQYLGQTRTILGLVRAGLGWAGLGIAIVPASARQFGVQNVVFKPMWRDDLQADVYMAWEPQQRNPAMLTFRQFALDYFAGRRA